jgi:hypothetical protein
VPTLSHKPRKDGAPTVEMKKKGGPPAQKLEVGCLHFPPFARTAKDGPPAFQSRTQIVKLGAPLFAHFAKGYFPPFAQTAKDGPPAAGPAFQSRTQIVKLGAPLFAHFAKGGIDAAGSAGFHFPENLIVRTASYPPLHKTQERGTHLCFVPTISKAGPPAGRFFISICAARLPR